MHSSHKRSVTVESSIVIAEGSSSYGSKRDSFLAEAWRFTSTSKRAVGRAVIAMESSGVVFNFPNHPPAFISTADGQTEGKRAKYVGGRFP